MSKTKILVVDDHEVVRKGICALLSTEPDFEVICDVADGFQAVEKAQELGPDIVVLDISMPGIDGLETARRICKVVPDSEIVFLSQHDSAEMVRQALRNGGRGYVVKSDIAQELIHAIRAALRKQRHVSTKFAAHV
jgi:DNA-binding NarL/FixJ family response regulator